MNRFGYVLLHLLFEFFSCRRDTHVRFLREENRILRARLDQPRLILSLEERSRLMRIGAELNHQVKGIINIVQYRTYVRWIKEQQTGKKPGRVGRPRTIGPDIRAAIARMAKEKSVWGYRRIVGELLKLRCRVCKSSLKRVLKEEGVHPQPLPPDRTSWPDYQPWNVFLKLYLNTMIACDFFCKLIWTPLGRQNAYVLVFLHLGTWKAWTSPATYHPDEEWVKQQARNFMMWLEDQGLQANYCLYDRDTKFTKGFDSLLGSGGIKPIKTPVMAPNANAFVENWVASIKRGCLGYFICFSRSHLKHIVDAYTKFYNEHRPHQGLGNQTLSFKQKVEQSTDHLHPVTIGCIGCQSELGGLLKHSYRKTA
ncbi:MAG: integrase core domain-containing protein [Planctomycetota bacterium]